MPTEKQTELIKARLSKFDLDFVKDVIAISTDGAAVMTKMGKDLLKLYGVERSTCNAHTVHLVVGEIFYKEKKSKVADNMMISTNRSKKKMMTVVTLNS